MPGSGDEYITSMYMEGSGLSTWRVPGLPRSGDEYITSMWTFGSDSEGLLCFFVESVPEHTCCEQVGLEQQMPRKDCTGQRNVCNQHK